MGGGKILSKHPKVQKKEWIGLIRKHYSPPHDNLYQGEKVFSRSEDNYVTECGNRDKTEGFRQRQRNLSCGYFSLPSRPYRSVGEPVLESLDLLIDNLGDSLPQKFHDELYVKQERMGTPSKLSDKERRYSQTIPYERDKDLVPNTSYLHRQERKNQNVGMKCIKSVLSETERRITACRSGQSYVWHVTQCQEEKDRARDLSRRKMFLQRLSSSTLHELLGVPLIEGTSIFAGTSRKKKLTIDDDDEDEDTMGPLKRPDWGQNLRDFRHSLKVNSLVKKLECISIIMHSLHNMRTKHLKSMNPMTAETLMLLRKDPFAAREFAGVANAIRIASSMAYTPPRDKVPSRQEKQLYESPASNMSVSSSIPNIFSNQLTLHTPDKLLRPSLGGMHRLSVPGRLASRMAYTPPRDTVPSRQETQLYESPASKMSVSSRLPNIFSNQLTLPTPDKILRPSLGGTHRRIASRMAYTPPRDKVPSRQETQLYESPASKMSVSSRLPNIFGTHKSVLKRNTRHIIKPVQEIGDRPVNLETWDDLVNVGSRNKILHPIRKIPPWQQTISTAETFLARKRNKEKIDEDEDVVNSVVENFQLKMRAFKEKIQKHTEQELEKIERERLIKFKYKLSSFENMQTLYETHSATLAEITRRINRALELSEEEKPTRWYQALMEEVKSIRATADPDVCHKIAKLERFFLEETTDISNVNEKLCLLTLSLPIPEICTFEMQSAITFVLKEILDVRVTLMAEWMRYRHLRSHEI